MKHSGVSEGPYRVFDKEVASVSAAAQALHCSIRTLYRLMEQGEYTHMQQAIDYISSLRSEGICNTSMRRGRPGDSYVFFGKEYPSLTAAVKEFGLVRRTVSLRSQRWGIDMRWAVMLSVLLTESRNSILVGGQEYSSFRAMPTAYRLPLEDICNYALTYDVHFGEALEALIPLYTSVGLDTVSDFDENSEFDSIDVSMTISLIRSNKNIYSISAAYTGTDGIAYFYTICKKCNAIMLLSEPQVRKFVHGNLCIKFALPEGVTVPRQLRERLARLMN